jgi:ATP-dependent 26S proteasome regulatory subunit
MSKDITDSNLITLISNRPNKSIVLFEDIDCLLDDINRKVDSKDKEVKISLSCILNILDGIYTPNDVIFIITTNDLSKIDEG